MDKRCERIGCINECENRFCSDFCRKSFSSQAGVAKRRAAAEALRRASLEAAEAAHKQTFMDALKAKLSPAKKHCGICGHFLKGGKKGRQTCGNCARISATAEMRAFEERRSIARKIRRVTNKKHRQFYESTFWYDRVEEIFG